MSPSSKERPSLVLRQLIHQDEAEHGEKRPPTTRIGVSMPTQYIISEKKHKDPARDQLTLCLHIVIASQALWFLRR